MTKYAAQTVFEHGLTCSMNVSRKHGELVSVYRTNKQLETIAEELQSQNEKKDVDAFFIVDLGEIVKNCDRWTKSLPRVKPFFAVKACNTVLVLQVLADLGVNFDCASREELETILGLGVIPDRIIFANTCKIPSHLSYAREHGVDLMTFDCESELHKIKDISPEARLLLRIRPCTGYRVLVQLDAKFGCTVEEGRELLYTAKSLDLSVQGISFHVGTMCEDPDAYVATLEKAKEMFKIAEDVGFHFSILDIGGGFYGNEDAIVSFEQIASKLRPCLDKLFPEDRKVTIIAEPGTYFADPAFTLYARIILKKQHRDSSVCNDNDAKKKGIPSPAFSYTLPDGRYGTMRYILLQKGHSSLRLVKTPCDCPTYSTTLWGPTCDSLDLIAENVQMAEMEMGDWLSITKVGAYTLTTSTRFNGMPVPRCHFVCPEAVWRRL